jgi:dienelactone hydrolase
MQLAFAGLVFFNLVFGVLVLWPDLFRGGSDSKSVPISSVGPWVGNALAMPPKADWSAREEGVAPVVFEGELLAGKATRIFAYVGFPDGKGPFPAVLLLHGGGGKAFRDWVIHWQRAGFVGIAPDLAGNGPDGKRLPDGGPDQSDGTKFRAFEAGDEREVWTYHTVSAAIRAHSLVRSLPEVDPERTSVTGISWGGYLTNIVASIDHRFRAAVPVYGCGFLHENSFWLPQFSTMTPALKDRWVRAFDPSFHLSRCQTPLLYLTGTNDFAYPLDSLQKSAALPKASVTRAITIERKHGHIWSFPEVDAFIRSHVLAEPALLKPAAATLSADRTELRCAVAVPEGRIAIRSASLCQTTDLQKPWKERHWTETAAQIDGSNIAAALPEGIAVIAFLNITDSRGLTVSSNYVERIP